MQAIPPPCKGNADAFVQSRETHPSCRAAGCPAAGPAKHRSPAAGRAEGLSWDPPHFPLPGPGGGACRWARALGSRESRQRWGCRGAGAGVTAPGAPTEGLGGGGCPAPAVSEKMAATLLHRWSPNGGGGELPRDPHLQMEHPAYFLVTPCDQQGCVSVRALPRLLFAGWFSQSR